MPSWRRGVVLGGLALAAGCGLACANYSAPVVLPVGLIFGHQHLPLTTDFDASELGPKQGKAKVRWLREPYFTGLPVAAWGSASIAEAAEEGHIERVHHADYEVLSVLGIYVEFTVYAYGD
jgi:hypothetical protein